MTKAQSSASSLIDLPFCTSQKVWLRPNVLEMCICYFGWPFCKVAENLWWEFNLLMHPYSGCWQRLQWSKKCYCSCCERQGNFLQEQNMVFQTTVLQKWIFHSAWEAHIGISRHVRKFPTNHRVFSITDWQPRLHSLQLHY